MNFVSDLPFMKDGLDRVNVIFFFTPSFIYLYFLDNLLDHGGALYISEIQRQCKVLSSIPYKGQTQSIIGIDTRIIIISRGKPMRQ